MDAYRQAQLLSGFGGLFGGLFGDSGAPYQDYADQYKRYLNKATGVQNPFYNAGVGALGGYQDWLSGMKDPTAFINRLMGSYQESPFARNQQTQALRAAQNMGSASGLTGSTPLQLQAQQNASNISAQDMNSWLQNVLGINTMYGSGLGNLIGRGQGSADVMSNLFGRGGEALGEAAYGRRAGQNQDFWNMIGGAGSLASMFL
jgi:hypothetical protein